jgi:hypothetical protein
MLTLLESHSKLGYIVVAGWDEPSLNIDISVSHVKSGNLNKKVLSRRATIQPQLKTETAIFGQIP